MTPDRAGLPARRRIVALVTSSLVLLATTASAIAQPSPSPGDPATPEADLTVSYPAGNARAFVDGEQNVWSLQVSQSLQPHGPYETGPVESSMDLELTESVDVLGDGTVELTLEVTDAEAAGFQAEIERAEALGRRVTLTYDEDGLTIPDPEQAFAFFGTPGALHMADIALKGHVIQPVLPAGEYHEGQQINSEAVLPAGWSRFAHRLEGTTTLGDSKRRQGVEVMNMASTQSAGTELLLPSLDNPVDTIQGGEADLNEFFLATMFKVLVPPGTDPHSLLPDFPIQVGEAHVHDHAPRRRRAPRRRGRVGPTLLVGAALLVLSACASHPQFAGTATSIRLDGPIQFQHESSLHLSSGILVHSGIRASAELAGTTIQPNEEAREDLGAQVWALTGKDVALDADWTIEQILTSELPAGSGEQPAGSGEQEAASNWAVPAGVALLAALGIGLLVRRAKNKQPAAATDD